MEMLEVLTLTLKLGDEGISWLKFQGICTVQLSIFI